MSRERSTVPGYQHVAIELEYWLATQAEAGVPELVLCWLLRNYASKIEMRGYVPRSWLYTDQRRACPNSRSTEPSPERR